MDLTRKKYSFYFFNHYFVIVAIIIAFIGGYFLGTEAPSDPDKAVSAIDNPYGKLNLRQTLPPYLLENVDFNIFWRVWKDLQTQFVDMPVGDTQLFYGALRGMTDSLKDPYTVFLDPEVYEEFSSDLAGQFEGIGAEIGIKEGALTVIAPIGGSPAERAGIKAGDLILEIDGRQTAGITLDLAVKWIRGPKDSSVAIKLFRKGEDKPRDEKITRGTIDIDSVEWERKAGNIFYIKITHFNDDTQALLGKAVAEMKADRPKSIIVDFRNNPGGYLELAIWMAGLWVDEDTVVVEKFSDGKERKHRSTNENVLSGIKTALLVNGGSASASEIVAGALQEYHLARLFGEKTFGKGSVQTLEELPDGSALKITVAKWLTPKGRSINEQGVEPDVQVTNKPPAEGEEEKDLQLEKAMEWVRK
ncbi:MAG: hypothetical protein G01um101418_125 [Parcubacteria group bacterium Gr01-1014_18]|nr:MAG: hypothetical protein Greene041636_429 [Parcubacteria group bacterium Greene0416_36]TSC81452.1 MAG: hypothetical protein G01um101418_125 [Parcubacteria group bacterium Gr01-1014_18]TSC99050.1 MAG: hypothetical protein Greene101420_406 [Parcubacteria group bacterium Greene1014_20]TSD07269.1 MAG: hypothetical protein Greene07142_285 [Parcubacteria group bacterium Greene0714_2]